MNYIDLENLTNDELNSFKDECDRIIISRDQKEESLDWQEKQVGKYKVKDFYILICNVSNEPPEIWSKSDGTYFSIILKDGDKDVYYDLMEDSEIASNENYKEEEHFIYEDIGEILPFGFREGMENSYQYEGGLLKGIEILKKHGFDIIAIDQEYNNDVSLENIK
ncbi:MAG: hypothetical protein AABY22_24705 [Nanoarchaeota archaeon]